MSGIDEQKPICPICKEIPNFFRFQLIRKGYHYNIWLLDESGMKRYNHKVPVIFDRNLYHQNEWKEDINSITSVICNACDANIKNKDDVKRLVTILKRVFKQSGGKQLPNG